jgi:hypothetical protein
MKEMRNKLPLQMVSKLNCKESYLLTKNFNLLALYIKTDDRLFKLCVNQEYLK